MKKEKKSKSRPASKVAKTSKPPSRASTATGIPMINEGSFL